MAGPPPRLLAGRTQWVAQVTRPLRAYVDTEVGGAVVLLAAAVLALAWANSPWGGTYEELWTTDLAVRLGDATLSMDLRHWVNDGLMAFFFLVVGLEIRRELDLGDLRDRRRVTVPVVAAVGGMTVPVLLYLALNAGTEAGHAWGIVMATDTAFALGVLAVVGARAPLRLRAFLLTLVIVDDVGALLVIALAYTDDLAVGPLVAALVLFAVVVAFRSAGVRGGAPYLVLGVGLWLALLQAGIHPTIAGVAMGLLATAYPPSQRDLREAASLWRRFREQPTSEYARTASRGLRRTLSANERLQTLYHPWTSFVVVPVFALANAGVPLSRELVSRAATSPVTVGIVLGLVVGKPLGITLASWLATRRRLGGFPLTVPWAPLLGAATVAGTGFTVSLFIAELSLEGRTLEEAKIGILTASVLAASLGWATFRGDAALPARLRTAGAAAAPLVDLADPVDPGRDHVRGPADAPVTLVEYGDFECPYCGRAEPVVRQLLVDFGTDLRYVFRHLPLHDVHEHAQLAAEAAEVAGAFGRFWEMHDLLFAHQDALTERDLLAYAGELDLDVDVFTAKLRRRKYAPRVAHDVEGADQSGVAGTPTFFANGRRHHGAFDLDGLTALVRSALTQAKAGHGAHVPPDG
jgi:Na+/H+ antiporter NhaA